MPRWSFTIVGALLGLAPLFASRLAFGAERTLLTYHPVPCTSEFGTLNNSSGRISQTCYRYAGYSARFGFTLQYSGATYFWLFNDPSFASENFILKKRKTRISFAHNGSGEFHVRLRSAADNSLLSQIVLGYGQLSSAQEINQSGPVYLEITASGFWLVMVE